MRRCSRYEGGCFDSAKFVDDVVIEMAGDECTLCGEDTSVTRRLLDDVRRSVTARAFTCVVVIEIVPPCRREMSHDLRSGSESVG